VTELASLIDEPALPWTLGLHEIFRARAERRDEDAIGRLAGLEALLRDDVDGATFAWLVRATSAARAENVELARSALLHIGSRASTLLVDPGAMAFLAEAYALVGTDEERRGARDLLAARCPSDVSGEVMSFIYEGAVARIVGLLDAALGDLDAAERALRDARDKAVTRRHAPWIAQTSYELAKLLRRRGREEESRELMAEAHRLARELGMAGLERSAASESPAAPPDRPRPTPSVTMERTGVDVRVARGETSVTVKDSRGVQILARLVQNPDEEIHVLALASDDPAASAPDTTAGEMLDDAAKRAYRARLAELDERIAAAERNADARSAGKLQEEKDAVVAELARAVGLGGRSRQAGSATERARVNVQRRLKDAIAKIAAADGELGRFFDRSVRTGTFCCFRPK
jgi:hypothetical protein